MEFQFNVNEYFKRPIVEIGNTLLPPDFAGDRRALWNTVNKVAEIVNEMGEASAHAQGLNKPITTAERMRQSDQNLYLLVEPDANNGNGAVTGMLKIGKKGLYVFDREGQHFQVTPPCVLDFYIHEKRQRSGLGRKLFEYMLDKENVKPHNLAIDRPSEKFLNFLHKHYYLQNPIKQMNNYVVFDGFFPESQRKESVEISPMNRTNGLQTTQSPNNQPLYGRYGAPRPPCSMGQIIHNTTPQKTGEPASPNDFKNSHDLISHQIPPQGEIGNNLYNANYTDIQYQQQNITEQQDKLIPQYQYRGRKITEVERNNINNMQHYNYRNYQGLNQSHGRPNPQMQPFDHQQPYSQDQIRMFPEKETHTRNLTHPDNGETQATQNVGNIWPAKIEPQQVYQVSQIPPNMPHNQQDQQKSQTSFASQQYNRQMKQNDLVRQPTSVSQDRYSTVPDIQQHIIPQQYQIQNGGEQQSNQSQNSPYLNYIPRQNIDQYKVPNYPQHDLTYQPPISEMPRVDVLPVQQKSLQQNMQNEQQAKNDIYSGQYPNIPLSNSTNLQTNPTIIGSVSQQYISPQVRQELPPSQHIPPHHQEMPQYHQQIQQYYQQALVAQNPPIGYPHDRYQAQTREQHPQYMNNQQMYIPRRSAPNVTQPVNQQLVVQKTYSSQQLPSHEQQRRLEAQEYQYVQSRPRERQSPPTAQEQKQDQKNELKAETVHSLLQVDPKYFKPDPIQLNQPPNTLTRSPTPRNSKEETVASLLNAEQEFFENGLLRDKYRVPSRPRFYERNPLQPQQELDGYPKQMEITQRGPKSEVPSPSIPQFSRQQESYPGNNHPVAHHLSNSEQYHDQPRAQQQLVPSNQHLVEQQLAPSGQYGNQKLPQFPRHQESYRGNNHQVLHHLSNSDQYHDQPRAQQQLVPLNQHLVEQQPGPSGQFGNQKLHDQPRSQHHLLPINSHPEEAQSYHHQRFRSDAPDLDLPTQQMIAKDPHFQLPQQYDITTQNQNRNQHQSIQEAQYESQEQDHHVPQQVASTPHPSERRSEGRQNYDIERRNDAASSIYNQGQPQQISPQYVPTVVEPVVREAANTRECRETVGHIAADVVENERESYQSPETIRQGSYIGNDFNPHPEGPTKVSTSTRVKPSDEEIGYRKKDINRQYGLNEVDMRRKGYKSAIIKRSTDHQEIDNLEFGYPPQLSKKRPPPRTILTMRGR